jgi:hypothetical protein
MTDVSRSAARLLALAGAAVMLLSHAALSASLAPDTAAAPRSAAGPKAKGYLSARYAYVGSSSAANAYSGLRLIGSFQASGFSDKVALRYRSHHWMSFERTAKHVLESPFENRHIVQTVSLETDGLIAPGVKTKLGRFFCGTDYSSSPAIDGGALTYEIGGFSIGGGAGRIVDLWNGGEGSSDISASGQIRYTAERVRLSAGFQSAAYLGAKQREVPAGVSVKLTGNLSLETYAGYDFEFQKLVRAGCRLSWWSDALSLNLSASRWRNPLDQLYLVDKSRGTAYWAPYSRDVPSTYDDVRVSGSYSRNGWGVRGTVGSMAGVRSGWMASTYLTSPYLFGFLVNLGGQAVRSDYIEFQSIDGIVMYQLRGLNLQVQSQIRGYEWFPRPATRVTDNYSEISAEYPLRKHLYVSAAVGGFFRTVGNEGFKPQAELRLVARI